MACCSSDWELILACVVMVVDADGIFIGRILKYSNSLPLNHSTSDSSTPFSATLNFKSPTPTHTHSAHFLSIPYSKPSHTTPPPFSLLNPNSQHFFHQTHPTHLWESLLQRGWLGLRRRLRHMFANDSHASTSSCLLFCQCDIVLHVQMHGECSILSDDSRSFESKGKHLYRLFIVTWALYDSSATLSFSKIAPGNKRSKATDNC